MTCRWRFAFAVFVLSGWFVVSVWLADRLIAQVKTSWVATPAPGLPAAHQQTTTTTPSTTVSLPDRWKCVLAKTPREVTDLLHKIGPGLAGRAHIAPDCPRDGAFWVWYEDRGVLYPHEKP